VRWVTAADRHAVSNSDITPWTVSGWVITL
jgi:hypothetical protein